MIHLRVKFDFIKKEDKFIPKSKYDVMTTLFVVTQKCDFNCEFCIEDAPNFFYEEELSTKETLNLIDEIGELGTREVILSGGEPMLRKDFKQIIRRIKSNGMKAVICTNGFYLDEEMADFIKDNLDAIQISVNSMDKNVYNKICNPPEDGYDKMMKSIELIKEKFAGKVILSSVPIKTNKHTLIGLMRFCKRMGFARFSLFRPAPVGRAYINKDLILSEKEYEELLDELSQEFIKLGGKKILVEQPYIKYSKLAEKYKSIMTFNYNCMAGINYFSITPDGNIIPCGSMSHIKELYMGNIRNESLKKIWEDDDRWKIFRLTDNECKDFCKFYKECRGGCKLMTHLSGNILARDPLCKSWIDENKCFEVVE